MIGGIDIHIPTSAGDSALEIAVRAVRQHWSQAVFENAATADRYGNFGQIPFGELNEVFVYRDAQAADRWDAEGALPELRNTMIHLIADDGVITIVVDDLDAAMHEVIATITSALNDDLLRFAAIRKAA